MKPENLSNGSKMELEVKYNGKTLNFHSTIVEKLQNSIFIKPITHDNKNLGFTDNCQIRFLYIQDKKVYIWENVKVKLVRYEGIVCHCIILYGNGNLHNRRAAFRMYIGEDMLLYVNTSTGPTAIQVLVKDISISGFAFISEQEFEVDRSIRLKLKSTINYDSLSAVIVRKVFNPHLNTYLYGCKFYEKYAFLDKYITQKQSEMLKKNSSTFASSPNRNRLNSKNEYANNVK